MTANGTPSPDLAARSSDLFEIRVSDGAVTPVFRRRGTNRSPAVSPDGKWLAFVSVADSGHAWTQPRLWLMSREADAKPKLLSAGFDAAVVQIVEAVQAGSPLAARLNKRFIRLAQMRGGRLTEADIAGSFGFFGSHDYREGLAAFLQRRSPRFTGR